MVTINEVSLKKTKKSLCVSSPSFFLQVKTHPFRREILRRDSLSLRWIPVSEWVLGIRSLSLIILLNHLPLEKHILHFFGLSRLLLYSVFWNIIRWRQIFQFFNISNQNIFFTNYPCEQSMSQRDSPYLRSYWDFRLQQHFTESDCCLSSNPEYNNTADVSSLFDVQLDLQFIVAEQRSDDSMITLHKTCQILRNRPCK